MKNEGELAKESRWGEVAEIQQRDAHERIQQVIVAAVIPCEGL